MLLKLLALILAIFLLTLVILLLASILATGTLIGLCLLALLSKRVIAILLIVVGVMLIILGATALSF